MTSQYRPFCLEISVWCTFRSRHDCRILPNPTALYFPLSFPFFFFGRSHPAIYLSTTHPPLHTIEPTNQQSNQQSNQQVGDPVDRSTRKPLSVQLGPGIMDTIFDGIQRPLNTIAKETGDVYVPRGVDVQSLNPDKEWEFSPKYFKVGDAIGPGDVFGTVFENEIMHTHKIMCPPNVVRHGIHPSMHMHMPGRTDKGREARRWWSSSRQCSRE